MEWTFNWNWVSIVVLAVPRSVISVCLLVCVADIPEPFLLKLPSAVPLDLLIFELLVLSCIFSVLFYAGIVRAPPASVGVFPPQGPARLSRKLPEFSMFGHCESKG